MFCVYVRVRLYDYIQMIIYSDMLAKRSGLKHTNEALELKGPLNTDCSSDLGGGHP